MRRGKFILTGAPGAGKTAVVRQLELEGFGTVEETATDVIALEQAKGVVEPWTDPGFIDRIVALQRQRRLTVTREVQFHDRSAFCTEALATFLGHPLSDLLRTEIEELKRSGFYQRRVFFVRLMGSIEATAARRIGLEDARRFETVHEHTYRAHGFELVFLEPGSVVDRVAAILQAL